MSLTSHRTVNQLGVDMNKALLKPKQFRRVYLKPTRVCFEPKRTRCGLRGLIIRPQKKLETTKFYLSAQAAHLPQTRGKLQGEEVVHAKRTEAHDELVRDAVTHVRGNAAAYPCAEPFQRT